VTDFIFGFAYINGRLDLRAAEGGVKSIKHQKKWPKGHQMIRKNPHDPHNPRPHPPMKGVAEQNLSYNPDSQLPTHNSQFTIHTMPEYKILYFCRRFGREHSEKATSNILTFHVKTKLNG